MKGIGDSIGNIKAIYTEVNNQYVYEDCALIDEIDDYLSKFNFERVETRWWDNWQPWGDALYINKEYL